MTNPDYPHGAGSADHPQQPGGWSAPGEPGQGQGGYTQYPYAQNPYAQTPYAQNPYPQNPYDQNPYDQNPYAPNPYPPTGPMPYAGFAMPQAGDPGTLDQPHYGIGFVDALKRFYRKYARFDGRASRSEFWWVALYLGAISFVVQIISVVGSVVSAGTADPSSTGPLGAIVGALLGALWLAHLVPAIALAIRRLHDANYAGVYCLMVLIPFAGPIILIVLAASPSSPAGARFDRPPVHQPY